MPSPQDGGLDQFDCGDEFGLIPAAVGAYSENGPIGAAINPRRVRLIARQRQRLDASHPIRAQSPADELGYIEEGFGGIRLTAAGRMRIAEG